VIPVVPYKRFVLSNGLTLVSKNEKQPMIVAERHAAPIVEVRLLVDAGYAAARRITTRPATARSGVPERAAP
jgi:hypothetical protein